MKKLNIFPTFVLPHNYKESIEKSFKLPSSYTYMSQEHEKMKYEKDPEIYRFEVEREMASEARKYKSVNKVDEKKEKEEKYSAV